MSQLPDSEDIYSDLDKPVEVYWGDKKISGIIDRICSAQLVDVRTEDGRIVCAVRSKTEPGKWVRAGKDDLWADAFYTMHHPWRPGDEITINAFLWAPGHGNGGADIVGLPLSGVVIEEKDRKTAIIEFKSTELGSELLRQIRLTNGWQKAMKITAVASATNSGAGLENVESPAGPSI